MYDNTLNNTYPDLPLLLLTTQWLLHNLLWPTGVVVLNGAVIPNHGFVLLDNIGESHDALLCLSDQLACCRPPYSGQQAIGNWYFPNGTRVPSSGAQWDFHRTRGQMVVSLHRRRGGENGVYRCEIPDAMNVFQTLYIGLYTNTTGECMYDTCTGFCVDLAKLEPARLKPQESIQQSIFDYLHIKA